MAKTIDPAGLQRQWCVTSSPQTDLLPPFASQLAIGTVANDWLYLYVILNTLYGLHGEKRKYLQSDLGPASLLVLTRRLFSVNTFSSRSV